jgi:hypothetical protein
MHFACGRYQWTEGDEAPMDKTSSRILSQVTRFKASQISSRELYQCWDSLMNEYGKRSVTFDKDRLPAIAGLARIVGEALQDQYLAGLWKGDLLESLLWDLRFIFRIFDNVIMLPHPGLGQHVQL